MLQRELAPQQPARIIGNAAQPLVGGLLLLRLRRIERWRSASFAVLLRRLGLLQCLFHGLTLVFPGLLIIVGGRVILAAALFRLGLLALFVTGLAGLVFGRLLRLALLLALLRIVVRLLALIAFAGFWPIWTDELLTKAEWDARIWFQRWI